MTGGYEDMACFEIVVHTRSSKVDSPTSDTKSPDSQQRASNRTERFRSEGFTAGGKGPYSLSPVNQHYTFSTAKGWSLFRLPGWSLFRLPQTLVQC